MFPCEPWLIMQLLNSDSGLAPSSMRRKTNLEVPQFTMWTQNSCLDRKYVELGICFIFRTVKNNYEVIYVCQYNPLRNSTSFRDLCYGITSSKCIRN